MIDKPNTKSQAIKLSMCMGAYGIALLIIAYIAPKYIEQAIMISSIPVVFFIVWWIDILAKELDWEISQEDE